MFASRLDCQPQYEALSYVWGDNTTSIQIWINDQCFMIGSNLYGVLTELRAEKSPCRVLWVDAICINQLDIPEKSQQVARMTEIYQKASSTIMWIGKEEQSLRSALLDILNLNKEPWCSDPERFDGRSLTVGSQIISSMEAVMSQPYFSRSWITQEIVVSRCPVIVAGSCKVKFEEISSAFYSVNMLQPGASKYAAQFVALDTIRMAIMKTRANKHEVAKVNNNQPRADLPDDRRLNHNTGRGPTVLPDLTQLLVSERDRGATDARDKVYALLGINGIAGCSQFSPDYTRTASELYTAVAAQLIQQSNGLRILSASQPRYSNLDIPSWVPDWSQPWRGGIDRRDSFSSGKSFNPHLCVNTKNKTISLYGVKVDTIRQMLRTPFMDWEYMDIVDPLADVLEREAEKLGFRRQFLYEEPAVTLLQVLVAGRGPFVMSKDLHRNDNYSCTGEVQWNSHNLHKRRWDRFKDNLAWLENEWDMFETAHGHFGLAPTCIIPGDSVWILGGGNVPFTLRQREQGGYKLIGECYLNGFMKDCVDTSKGAPDRIVIS
ncbi:hypothetical protein NM208_g7903 [Fusarium decemcellulare]|uniref:Uncharacterized protein n=2 Tax=Fusarium decemcellulare TaxID=57161 RepID=A0ACC1S7K5_9HYPO|nr:hypothetical protein NM208_g11016 [Fusarium decemcellulare]KAJ3533620.1 hypothetical protein NM208_g7903 [Fusarium decemcellulare]